MFAQQPVKEEYIVQEIKRVALDTAGWLKFIGIFFIIYGALMAITIVGILIAWLPIWMGILLYSAGKKANDAQYTNNPIYLVEMMKKFKTFFIIQGVLMILGIVALIFVFVVVGVGFFTSLRGFESY